MPGCEAVGRAADGRVVWIFGGSLGRTAQGAIAERRTDRRRPRDRGARRRGSGARRRTRDRRSRGVAAVRVARAAHRRRERARARRHRLGRPRRRAGCQAARRRASRCGRSQCRGARACRATRCRCDAPTRRSRRPRRGLQGRIRRRRPELRLRLLWGEPATAAVQAAAPGATIVNLGQSAGATAELASADVRFKSLSILGHTNFAVPPDELAEHYRRLVDHAVAGEIRLDVERVPLDSSPTRGAVRPTAREQSSSSSRSCGDAPVVAMASGRLAS